MGNFKVLVVDEDMPFLFDLEDHGHKFVPEVLNPFDVNDSMAYEFVFAFGKRVAQATAAGEADLVIVGNNRGTGLLYAKCVASTMQCKTVIVWNEYRTGDEQPYAALGFTHFASRTVGLDPIVAQILGLTLE